MDIICGNGRHFNDANVVKECSEKRGGCDRCVPLDEKKIGQLTRKQEIQVIWPKNMPPASWHT